MKNNSKNKNSNQYEKQFSAPSISQKQSKVNKLKLDSTNCNSTSNYPLQPQRHSEPQDASSSAFSTIRSIRFKNYLSSQNLNLQFSSQKSRSKTSNNSTSNNGSNNFFAQFFNKQNSEQNTNTVSSRRVMESSVDSSMIPMDYSLTLSSNNDNVFLDNQNSIPNAIDELSEDAEEGEGEDDDVDDDYQIQKPKINQLNNLLCSQSSSISDVAYDEYYCDQSNPSLYLGISNHGPVPHYYFSQEEISKTSHYKNSKNLINRSLQKSMRSIHRSFRKIKAQRHSDTTSNRPRDSQNSSHIKNSNFNLKSFSVKMSNSKTKSPIIKSSSPTILANKNIPSQQHFRFPSENNGKSQSTTSATSNKVLKFSKSTKLAESDEEYTTHTEIISEPISSHQQLIQHHHNSQKSPSQKSFRNRNLKREKSASIMVINKIGENNIISGTPTELIPSYLHKSHGHLVAISQPGSPLFATKNFNNFNKNSVKMKKSRSFNKLLNQSTKKPSHERRFSRQFYSNFQQNWSGSPTPSRSFLNLNSLRFDSRTKSYCTGVGFEGYGIFVEIKIKIHIKISK